MIGGVMSGMKAGLNFPTWPLIDGGVLPEVLFEKSMWNTTNFNNYDNETGFMPALIQVIHRNLAYLISVLMVIFSWQVFKTTNSSRLRRNTILLLLVLTTQVLLGIFTLINCKGMVPVGLGVFHQAFALILLSVMLLEYYLIRGRY